jgi:gliding motility-associated-like protein
MSRNNSYVADSSGTYWVAVTKNGCTLTDSIQLTFINIAQDLGPDVLLCVDDPIHFNLEATLPAGATNLWSSGATDPTYAVNDTGTYWLQVSLEPCAASDTFRINYDPFCYCHFAMPTAFSPNGDGTNDLYKPALVPGCPVSSYMLSIYNRWGERIFTGTKPEIGWDGTYQGTQADVGTYMYRIDFLGGTRKKKYMQQGDITLIR